MIFRNLYRLLPGCVKVRLLQISLQGWAVLAYFCALLLCDYVYKDKCVKEVGSAKDLIHQCTSNCIVLPTRYNLVALPYSPFLYKKKQARAACHESVLIPAVPAPHPPRTPPPPSTPSMIPKSLILDCIRYKGLILSTLPGSHSSFVEGTVRFEMLISAALYSSLDADKSLAAVVLFSAFPLAVCFLLTSLSAVRFPYTLHLLTFSGLTGVRAKDPVPPPIHPHPHRCRDRP